MTEPAGPEDDPFEAARLRTLGRLLPGALHELANPLLALGGTVELLVDEAEPGTRSAERLELVRRTSDEVAALVRILQRLARERFEPEAELDLAAFAAETAALAHRFSTVGDARLDVRTGSTTSVRARPAALRQALLASVLDALETATPGESIVVRVDGSSVSVKGAVVELPLAEA